jgi:hypothetical protein
MATAISSEELFGNKKPVSSEELFGKKAVSTESLFGSKEGLWDRFVKATGAESDMMSSPANAEILRNVVGGGSAWIPTGIMKFATVGEQGGVEKFGEDLANKVSEKIVGTPSTEVGKLAQKQIATPFEILSEKSQQAGDWVYDKTGSPLLATATRVAGEAIPFVAPVVVAKGLKGIKGAVKAPEIDLGKVSEKPYSITPDVSAELKVSVPKEVAPEIKAQKVEPAANVEGKSITAEDFELNPDIMKDFQKGVVAFQVDGKTISAKIGSKVNGQEVYNHADLGVAKGLDFDKAVPGFLDKQGKFVEQYPTVKTVADRPSGETVGVSPEQALPARSAESNLLAHEGVKAEIPKAETPLEGKPAKAAVDINQDLIDKGFEGLPENELSRYNPIQKAEEVGKAQELVSNPDFFEIAKGNKPMPQDVHPQVLFNIAINEATKAGNIDMLMDLAKSPIAEQRSLAAQQLGASAWEKPVNNIVKTINEVKKVRESKIKNPKAKEVVKTKLKEEMQKINLPKEDLIWEKFLSKIEC